MTKLNIYEKEIEVVRGTRYKRAPAGRNYADLDSLIDIVLESDQQITYN